MQVDGVIEQYAIGGAVGATFFLEPMNTLDVDIFFTFKAEPSGPILSLQPIFDYLTARGCTLQGEYVVIGGWPVQFLPPTSPLVEDALRQAVTMNMDGVPVRVFNPEYLAAIALQTGRTKDKTRLLQFVQASALQISLFETILEDHKLLDRWQQFKRQFLGG